MRVGWCCLCLQPLELPPLHQLQAAPSWPGDDPIRLHIALVETVDVMDMDSPSIAMVQEPATAAAAAATQAN